MAVRDSDARRHLDFTQGLLTELLVARRSELDARLLDRVACTVKQQLSSVAPSHQAAALMSRGGAAAGASGGGRAESRGQLQRWETAGTLEEDEGADHSAQQERTLTEEEVAAAALVSTKAEHGRGVGWPAASDAGAAASRVCHELSRLDEQLRVKATDEVGGAELLAVKRLIRESEARAACRYAGEQYCDSTRPASVLVLLNCFNIVRTYRLNGLENQLLTNRRNRVSVCRCDHSPGIYLVSSSSPSSLT